MLGETHMVATTSTGLAGLYGLYHMGQTYGVDTWQGAFAETISEMIGFTGSLEKIPFMFVLPICVAGLLLGSLLPDIDSKKSKLGRFVPFVEDLLGHRTITHTIWVVLLLFIGAYFSGSLFIWMTAFGYFFHVVQDSFSKQGVAWLYPLGEGYRSYGYAKVKQGFHIPLYRVGSTAEYLIGFVFALLLLWTIFKWTPILFASF